jgi:hypothetical protein
MKPERIAVVVLTAFIVGAVATLCAALVHQACFHSSPVFDRPEPGTPRAHYCSAASPGAAWVILIAVPTACAVGALPLLRLRVGAFWAVIAVLCVLMFANAWVASSLAFSSTI